MRLTHTIYFNEFVRPACLNVHSDLEWSTAIATGFGVTSQGNEWLCIIIAVGCQRLRGIIESYDSQLIYCRGFSWQQRFVKSSTHQVSTQKMQKNLQGTHK